MDIYIKISGVNQPTFVGINKYTKIACPFHPYDFEHYTAPQTIIESGACIMAAKQYYDFLPDNEKNGKFNVEKANAEDIRYFLQGV